MKRLLAMAAVAATGLVAASPASAAPDTPVGTLTIQEGSTPILSWSWGLTVPVTTGGGGGGAGKVQLDDVTLTKRINPLSTELVRTAATGAHYPQAVVSVPVGGPLSPFAIEYKLKDVIVSSVAQSGAGAESVETVKLAYGSFELTIGTSKFGWANPG